MKHKAVSLFGSLKVKKERISPVTYYVLILEPQIQTLKQVKYTLHILYVLILAAPPFT